MDHPWDPADTAPMRDALRLAEATARLGNVPVGAVVVVDGETIARAANLRDTLQDPTAHAELLALREAAQAMGSWRLDGVTLYVTMEPCAMCAGAIAQARVARLVYGVDEPKTGAVRTTARLLDGAPVSVVEGVLADESKALVTAFFDALRQRGRAAPRR
ncbi:MAG: nucleoside deaminase [Deltaproteobacteria bacterium]|nr:nucleoside deaminase [Deltaproteobacteria bacterium]MCB9787289.1 nucleoside deaminase [Deltaproteobacteria bacterium]